MDQSSELNIGIARIECSMDQEGENIIKKELTLISRRSFVSKWVQLFSSPGLMQAVHVFYGVKKKRTEKKRLVPMRIELMTSALLARRSNQLS